MAQGSYRGWSNLLRIGNNYIALFVGEVEQAGLRLRLIRYSGPYMPKAGDRVIGMVTDIQPLSLTIDINSYVDGYIMANSIFRRRIDASKVDLSKVANIGDLVLAKVQLTERGKDVLLVPERNWKISGDATVTISPAKASYMLRQKDGLLQRLRKHVRDLLVGANGVIVIRGEGEGLERVKAALNAINMAKGLTDIDKVVKEVLEVG